MTNIVWLRNDLRIEDNPALHGVQQEKAPVVPVYILNPEAISPGGASKWWLHYSLEALSKQLAALGSPLVIRMGTPTTELPALAKECCANAVFWNRACNSDDTAIETALQDAGVARRVFSCSNYLVSPSDVLNNSNAPFKVFTPFWKRASGLPVAEPLSAPKTLAPHAAPPAGVSLDALQLLPTTDWASGFHEQWQPGETGAKTRLAHFIKFGLDDYGDARDYPSQTGTSKLSPHLHFGEISPRIIAHDITRACEAQRSPQLQFMAETFLRQLYWREFGMYLRHHFPDMRHSPMRPQFERFPWRDDADQLKRWQRGQTGYPIVDAGMRELWHTGWMHNRVRMIVASFLVKHLLLPWQSGAIWFWDTLVDADVANNTLGWQWVSGCGPDAAPYFRIFNPVLQSQKFDATGDYLRHWVPELAQMDNKHVHAPWTASQAELRNASDYPEPIVDHKEARQRALDAFAFTRNR